MLGWGNVMNKVAISLGLLLASTAISSAADAIVDEPVVIVAEPSGQWSGLYVGGQIGYAWANRDWNGDFLGSPIPDDQYNFDMDGGQVGAHIGYNWQVDNFVFGVEADASWSKVDDHLTQTTGPFSTAVEAEMDWLATVRGRVGYAWDRFLIYGTGGVAFAHVDTDVETSVFGSPYSSDRAGETHTGWVAGVGVETMVSEKISLRFEYLHADFSNENYDYDLINVSPDDDTFGSADLDVDMIRLGVSYHF